MTREEAVKQAMESLDAWYRGKPDNVQIERVLKQLRLEAQANIVFENVLELKK